jgi:hypothetical protein
MRYIKYALLTFCLITVTFLFWLVSTPCGLDFSGDGVCELTYISEVSSHEDFDDSSCQSITSTEFRNECYSLVAQKKQQPSSCFKIRGDVERTELCLGHPSVPTIKAKFGEQNEKFCSVMQRSNISADFKARWADACHFLVSKQTNDTAMCLRITDHQFYFDCTRYIALAKNDASICKLIERRLPFPKNYTSPLFSVKGCENFVENKGHFTFFWKNK